MNLDAYFLPLNQSSQVTDAIYSRAKLYSSPPRHFNLLNFLRENDEKQLMKLLTAGLLLLFTFTSAFALTEDEASCARDLLLADAQKAIDNMSAEELKAALDKYNELEAKKALSEKDKERAEKLAKLLLLIEKKGMVKIKDCNELRIKEDTAESRALLEEIKKYCENSPVDVWAEITKTGQIKLTFSHGSNQGTQTVTLGGGGKMTLGYKGQEIKLGGNISSASFSSPTSKSASLKYDHLLDYSIDLGIANLETFLKWAGTFESTQTPNGLKEDDTYIRRSVVDLGIRYDLLSTDKLKLNVGTGAGVSYLDQQAIGKPHESVLAPSIVVTTDLVYKPTKTAELFINTRLQRDILTDIPRTVAGVKGGAKMSFGPLGTGVEYSTDYDDARTGTKVNHQFTANIFASIDPDDWKSEKKRKESKAARERERLLWEQTLARVRELRALEEEEKKKKEKEKKP